MKGVKYTGSYTVRADETGPNKKMTVPSLIRVMQDASMQNSIEFNFSVWDLEKDDISWVLLRKRLDFLRLPSLNEKVKVITYPIATERFLAYRDYKMYDREGNLIAQAASTWTLINTKTRKLEKLPQKFSFMKAPLGELVLEPPRSKIVKPQKVDFSKEFRIDYHDTDWNKHVNNVFIAKSIIESSPFDMLENRSIKQLEYHVKSESFYGDTLIINGEIASAHEYRYVVINKSHSKVVAYGTILWG